MTTTTTVSAALNQLAEYMPLDSTVSTLSEKDGTTWRVRVLIVDRNRLVRDITFLVALVAPLRLDSRSRLIVPGHGVNAGDHVVRTLAAALYMDDRALSNHAV